MSADGREAAVDLALLDEVAAATRLHEGQAGVLRVLAALADQGRAPTNVVARAARLPVPLAAAVLNELRVRDLVDAHRPAGLTGAGRALAEQLALVTPDAPELRESAQATGAEPLPPRLQAVADELRLLMDAGPEVDVTLDQAFATPETKVRRVLAMVHAGTLPTPSLLAIGDDDLISVAIEKVQAALEVRLVGELVVVDVSEPVLAAVREHVTATPLTVVAHDLREPLPADVRARASAAMTDPPYTTHGARLFLTRALEGLRPGPGWDLWLHFGTKPAGVAAEVMATLGELGLVVRSLAPRFSAYDGAGVIGGTSDAWRLEVTGQWAGHQHGEQQAYDGPLYTADLRNRARTYRCHGCSETFLVGPREQITTIGALKSTGCPRCGGTTFSPGRLAADPTPAAPSAPPTTPVSAPDPGAPVTIRPARTGDLDTIVGYEITIAEESFGDDALTEPERHRSRLEKALDRDPEGCLVAVDAVDAPIGWCWMAINTNFLTEEKYANFRSLAVSPGPDSSEVARELIRAGLDYAWQHGVTDVTGKVSAANLPMRTLYREAGFEPRHLTMELKRTENSADDRPDEEAP